MDANISLCLTCLKYCAESDHPERVWLSSTTDWQATAKDFASAVNESRWDSAASSPKDDGTWVINDYYDKFFFKYSTIFYTRSNESDYWIDFPALAKARVLAQQQYRDVMEATASSRPRKTWWFGQNGSHPSIEIEQVDSQNRYMVARFQHWREWEESATRATGGTIRCQLVRLANPGPNVFPIRVVRYWHDWMKEDGTIPERDRGIADLVDGLRQRAIPYDKLAPLRNGAAERICVFGANEKIRTHLVVETLQKDGVKAVFVGRVAAYGFESLLQSSLRTAMHFPVCIADLSEGAGTPLEVQAVVGAGKIVAGLYPKGGIATQFLKDNEIYSQSFKLFTYDWPTNTPDAETGFNGSHVKSLGHTVKAALEWARNKVNQTTNALTTAFPWREYETIPPREAIRFDGVCRCGG
jgi:hypothetical protein